MKGAIGNCVKSCRALPAVAVCLFVFASAQAGPAPTYNVIDLGTLGGISSQALGINNSGQIVGYAATTNQPHHAAFWANSSSPPIDLGALGGTFGEALGINDSGEIVGDATTPADAEDDAAVWTNHNSGAVDLGSLGGPDGAAQGINGLGQMVGYATASNGDTHATFWANSSSSAIDLGTLGGTFGEALGINGIGQIVGDALTTSNAADHAAFWANNSSSAVDLGSLGGTYSGASSINNSGQIVGYAYTTSNATYHATVWTNTSTGPIDLGTLGGADSQANGNNGTGQIVGYSQTTSNTDTHATLWTNSSSSAIVDLNSLIPTNSGWVLQQANAINDSGEIVGFGTIGSNTHAFALVTGSVQSISAPKYVSIWIASTNVFLAFPTISNAFYDVQCTTNLVSAVWSTIASNIAGTGGIITNTNIGGATVPRRFYHVGAHF